MQQTITKDVQVTPSEINEYYNNIPKDSLPFMNSEIEVGQIVKEPNISPEEEKSVIEKINGLRDRIIKGENFATLAILYSEDPGSASKGGELGFIGRGQLVAEFEAVAFKLEKDEVSDVVKTKFGYHILQLIERRGENINVRHILIKPKVSAYEMQKSINFLDSIHHLILIDSLTFAEAAIKFSDDKDSKNNGGILVNPLSGTTKFELNQVESTIFFVIDKMKIGEMSKPLPMNTLDGNKAYRILYLQSKTLPHVANLKDDYQKIKETVLAEKQSKIVNEWIYEKKKSTYININKEYIDCNFKNDWFN